MPAGGDAPGRRNAAACRAQSCDAIREWLLLGLELNVHFHALGLDGLFAPGADGTLRFQRMPPPSDADVARLVATIARRVARLLVRRGLVDDADAIDPLSAPDEVHTGLVRVLASMVLATSHEEMNTGG